MYCCSSVFFLFVSCKTDGIAYEKTENFQLAAPIIHVDSLLFRDAATITISFGFPNSEIRYTLDGKKVDGESPIYDGPHIINNASRIKAMAFHYDFKNSEQTVVQVEKIRHNISNAAITIEPEPHGSYRGLGAIGLVDLQKGNLQFRGGSQWLGFQTGKMTINIDLANEMQLSLLKVSCLQTMAGGYFP